MTAEMPNQPHDLLQKRDTLNDIPILSFTPFSFMSHQTTAPYDIIFAGGGTTGCVVAGRLAAADPSLKILIIEAGKHTKDVSTHTQPGRFFTNLTSGGDTFTFHAAKPSEALGNRPCIIPSGKAMGGGSSVNFMMYTRASPSDYDNWENLENPGWGSKDLVPLSNKAETFEPNMKNHGTSGPIKISGGIQTNIARQYLAVAAARDKERGFTEDTNDFSVSSVDVYSPWFKYISSDTGRRSDTAHHYIYNQAHNKNLHLLPHCRVKRALFEKERAVGVEYISHDADAADKTAVVAVYASRLVVLASGAFGSPAILERSGIGASDLLKAHDIRQIVSLPGVGENYNDHNLVFVPYHTTDDELTMDDIFHGKDEAIKPYEEQWRRAGKGMMAHNGIEAGIKIRPNAKDLEVLGPTFTSRWQEFFANQPDKPVMWIGALAGYTGGNAAVAGRKLYTVIYYTEYPASTGRTHISSADPYTPLDVEPGFLDKPEDVAVLRWSYKWSREMARRMESYRGEFAAEHPLFPAGSAAACFETKGPVPVSAPDIVYSAEDDEAIDNYHRAVVNTTWHSLGTCAMKSRDQGGVVDSRLNVYGVKNLKIADLSIAPTNVGANTYNTALVVGERAAVIIAEELGIKGV
ncbi:GMC oxidoreductase-domain-containing protein [Mycena maculata]|uniref:GMC oxidoreductase-domain-containing protein n=1 Tax=Mycena maculata TaxID=230809 RepID=A0AAD7JDB0_9AGAR|nr:GMC oxidoreductase-domain-containing protein [Mycena maculata]